MSLNMTKFIGRLNFESGLCWVDKLLQMKSVNTAISILVRCTVVFSQIYCTHRNVTKSD